MISSRAEVQIRFLSVRWATVTKSGAVMYQVEDMRRWRSEQERCSPLQGHDPQGGGWVGEGYCHIVGYAGRLYPNRVLFSPS